MSETESQRMVPLPNSKRTGVKLSDSTWKAIEMLASNRGQTWREWCASIISGLPNDSNIAASIRNVVVDELLTNVILGDRPDDLAAMEANALTRNSGIVDDETLKPYLSLARGESDFGGFTIFFGIDEEGCDFLAVRNGLRDSVHFVTTLKGNSE